MNENKEQETKIEKGNFEPNPRGWVRKVRDSRDFHSAQLLMIRLSVSPDRRMSS